MDLLNTIKSDSQITLSQSTKEIDMELFTGVTIFDDSFDDDDISSSDDENDDDNSNNEFITTPKKKRSNSTNNTNNNSNSNTNKTIQFKKWINEYYKDMENYRIHRNQRYDSFINELSQVENQHLTADEIKNLEYEHYQKESSYLRLKRKLNQKEFIPLFKYGRFNPNNKISSSTTNTSSAGTSSSLKTPNRRSGTFSSQGSLSPPSNITTADLKKQNRQSTSNLSPAAQQLYSQQINIQEINNNKDKESNNNNGGTVYFNNPPTVTFLTPPKQQGGSLSSSTGMSPPMTPLQDEEGFDRSNYRRTKSISSITKRNNNNNIAGNGGEDGSTIGREFQNFTPLKNLNVGKNKSYTMMFKLDHKVILEQTEKLLEEKEKDTRMAAEIGQSLLEKNEDLEEEMRALKQRLQEQEALNESLKLFNQQVDKLKNENVFLSNQVSTAKQENELLFNKELELSTQLDQQSTKLKSIEGYSPMKTKTIKQQKEEIEELKLAVEGLQSSQGKLKKNRDRLLSANESLQISVHDLKYQLDGKIDESEFEKLKGKVKVLRQKNKQLQIQVEQTQLSPESRSIKNPELILKSAYNDLIKNEELISSTPKITNLRVLSDARSLLSRLESEIINVDNCSLISTLISFLDQDSSSIFLNYTNNIQNSNSFSSSDLISTISNLNNQFNTTIGSGNNSNSNNNSNNNHQFISNNNNNNLLDKLTNNSNSILSGLNDSFESDRSINLQSDSKSALYMLICIISINKYTKYDSNKRFKEFDEFEQEEKNKLKIKLKEYKDLSEELQDSLESAQSQNRMLQEQIDQLNIESGQNNNQQYSTMADELRESSMFERNYQDEIDAIKAEMVQQLDSFSIAQQLTIQSKDKEIVEIKSEFQLKIIDLEVLLDERLHLIQDYLVRIEELDSSILDHQYRSTERDRVIQEIEQSIREKDELIGQNVVEIQSIQNLLEEKELQLLEKDIEIKVKTKQLLDKDQLILTFENSIIEKDQLIKEKDQLINQQSTDIIELESTTSTKDQLIREKDNLIKEKQQLIRDRDQTIQEKVEIINDQSNHIVSKDLIILEKDSKIQKLEDHSTRQNEIVLEKHEEFESTLADKDREITRLKEDIENIKSGLSGNQQEFESKLADKDREITRLNEEIQSKLAEKDREITRLNQEIEKIKSDLSGNQQEFKSKVESLMERYQQIEALSLEKEQLIASQEKELMEIKQLKSQLEESYNSLISLHSNCESNKSLEIQSIVESVCLKLDSIDQLNQRFSTEFNDKFELLSTHSKQSIIEKCNQVDQLSKQIKELQEIIEQLKQQATQEQDKSESLINELMDKDEDIDSITLENTKLKEQVEELQSKVESKAKKHQVLKRELSIQFDQMKEFEAELEKKRQEESTFIQQEEAPSTPQINTIQQQEPEYSEEEKCAYIDWINSALGKDVDLKSRLPIPEQGEKFFEACNDGLLLCKLINDSIPDTIDERVLNKDNLNELRINENQVLCINSAKAIGCNVVSVGASDLVEGRAHLILGLTWQIIKIGLFSRINITNHPELYRLLDDGETIEDLLKFPVEQILLRWFNYHLAAAGHARRVRNFSDDVKDSENYTILLKQIAPKNARVDNSALKESNPERRATLVLRNANKLGCKKFLKPKDIVDGFQKLNLAFVANLFNNHPALEPFTDEKLVVDCIQFEETREEKTFRNWMNSLGVEPFVNNLYEGTYDGLVLIQLFDKIYPGLVDQKRVNYPPYKAIGAEMKKLENCNYAIALGKECRYSLVGIDGKNIYDRNKTLTLSILWQLMRGHVLAILTNLGSNNGKPISDSDIVNWANSVLQSVDKKLISGFKDSSIATSLPILDIIEVVAPGSVDHSMVTHTGTDADNLLNAKLAISTARKNGSVLMALPEDIVEVKPKMILTIFASLWEVNLKTQSSKLK